ncbi:hypothetical protein FNV43_RR00727 [Rhamnella rubrinervis]|uniref:Uncharacterized protein n=1 Tax=Rhamnella rubrinervis TaxID=2594499 RepID=A0A8K0HPP7_9ROSA|nr:hypothetical protein FNV43_RR00727 [Rhamnella rubrinervis]
MHQTRCKSGSYKDAFVKWIGLCFVSQDNFSVTVEAAKEFSDVSYMVLLSQYESAFFLIFSDQTKDRPITQMTMARALECPKTAYMPVTNATAIAAKKYGKLLVLSCFRANKRWIKKAELENTMAMVSDMMNAAFFIELQLPGLVLLHSHNCLAR